MGKSRKRRQFAAKEKAVPMPEPKLEEINEEFDEVEETDAEEGEEERLLMPPPKRTVLLAVALLSFTGFGGYLAFSKGLFEKSPASTPPPVAVEAPKLDPQAVWRTLEVPSANKVTGLELPTPTEITSSRRYITITAKCTGEVKWLVQSQAKIAIEVLESKLTNSVMIFPNNKEADVITVSAYTVVDGKPGDMATTTIKVTAPIPVKPVSIDPPAVEKPPEPKVEPKVEPVVEKPPEPVSSMLAPKHITFVTDKTKTAQKTANELVSDKAFRTWLMQQGIEVHELSMTDDLDTPKMKQYVQQHGTPVYVLQNDKGNVLHSDKVVSITGIKDGIAKFKK
jgi:hypothetical protein